MAAKTEKKEYVPTPVKDPGFDEFPTEGHFADAVSGEHQGRYGVVEYVSPDHKTAVLRTRDDDNARLTVDYSDLRPSRAGKR